MIFTTKSLIYTCGTGVIGLLFYYILGVALKQQILGIVIALFFAAIGFAIGTFKIPEIDTFEITKKAGGEYIDEAFFKWWKFRKKGNVIYTYLGTEEENK